MKNYYHILGLSFESNPEKELIDAAFKALVKIYHPDVFKGDKKSRDREITEKNEAYEILNDSEKKKSMMKDYQIFIIKIFLTTQMKILKIKMFLTRNLSTKIGK